jgi:hypothetical protein
VVDYKIITRVWVERELGQCSSWELLTLKTEQIYGNKLISKNRWNEIYLNLLKFGTIEKKAFSSRLQNNWRILETENNFKNVA